jgi:spore coat protein A, manganese oxidase
VQTDPNAAIYRYPNAQPATTLWFHDHTLGMTRISVLSGLAGMYFVRDQYDTGAANNPLGLPAGNQEIERVLQDRQFDTNGQWYFPDSSSNGQGLNGDPTNPLIHPNWIPEYFGDAIVVNGRTWPYLEVEPRRYRFRVVNGSNARFFRVGLVDSTSAAAGRQRPSRCVVRRITLPYRALGRCRRTCEWSSRPSMPRTSSAPDASMRQISSMSNSFWR